MTDNFNDDLDVVLTPEDEDHADLLDTAIRQLTLMAGVPFPHPLLGPEELTWLAVVYGVPSAIINTSNDQGLIGLIAHQMHHIALSCHPVYLDLPASVIRRMLADDRLGALIRALHESVSVEMQTLSPTTLADEDGHPSSLWGVYFVGRMLGYFPSEDAADHYREMMLYAHIFRGL